MATAQIVRWGNSLAVRIPKPLAEQAGVEEGDPIVIEAERGQLRLKRKEKVPSLKELVAQITPENRHGETLVDREVGKEGVKW